MEREDIEEIKRHFGVIAEGLRSDLHQVAEGHGVIRNEVQQFREEVRQEFGEVRSFLRISFMSEGGSGTKVPDLSIEVDDVDEAFKRMKKARVKIEYPLTDEPWGVRRFFVRDPFGKLVNILA